MESSPLPDDLAHPRGEHAHLIANVSVAIALLAIAGCLIAFGTVAILS